jgi:hypothetical protein
MIPNHRYISEFTETAGRPEFIESEVPDQEIVGHPVQAFQLIKRLTIEWKDVKKIMGQASASWESKSMTIIYLILLSLFSNAVFTAKLQTSF